MTANEIVQRMPQAFNSQAAGDMEATVQYRLSEPMYVVIKSGQCKVFDGEAPDPEVTLSIDDDDFVALMQGELNAMNAFMSGKLKLDGDLLLAQRLASLFDASKL